jgi:hypothetical protein
LVQTIRFLALMGGLCGSACLAAEVVVLDSVRCALDPAADLSKIACKTLGAKSVQVVAGTKIADVKPAGECYVIEMGATNIRSENFTAPVYLETNPNVPTPVTYPRVRLLQPYRLWYLAGPDAQPQPLGEGFSFVMAQPVESLGGNVVKIKNESTAELTKRGMVSLCEILADEVGNAVAQRIVLGRSDRLTPAQVPRSYNTPAESELYRRLDRPIFAAGKVSYQPDGTATIDMALHNRLPVRVTGTVRREETREESLARVNLGGAIALNKTENNMTFELAPNEKKVLKFTVVAPLVARGLPERSTFEVRSLVLHSQ